MNFSGRLAFLLEKKGWSAAQLATELGSKPSLVHYYLKANRIPHGTILVEIAKLFGVTIDWLLMGQESAQSTDQGFLLSEEAKALEEIKRLDPEAHESIGRIIDTVFRKTTISSELLSAEAEIGLSHASAAKKLAAKSAQKRKAAAPSVDKPSPGPAVDSRSK